MGSYRIEWKRSAEKELRRLPVETISRIVESVGTLAVDPTPHGSRKLTGSDRNYRIRVGDYRVVYSIFRDRLIVEVVRVGHRREVYR